MLPFKNLGEGVDENLGLGIAHVLTTRLSSIKQLAVRPTNSVRKYAGHSQDAAQIGQELNVELVLDSSFPAYLNAALELMQTLESQSIYISPFDKAVIYSKLDDREQALKWLEKRLTSEYALSPTLMLRRSLTTLAPNRAFRNC